MPSHIPDPTAVRQLFPSDANRPRPTLTMAANPHRRDDRGGEARNPASGAATYKPKGHDMQLHRAQNGALPVRITTIGGEVVDGTILRRDRYTITVADERHETLYFKHAIESVRITLAAPAAATPSLEGLPADEGEDD